MSLTYDEFSKLPASEKVLLCKMDANIKFKIFILDTGSTYYKMVPHFVKTISVDGTELTKATSSTLISGQFFFDPKLGKLWVRMPDDSNPKTKRVVCTYTFHFSTITYNLPNDLDEGEVIEWDNRIDSIGTLGQTLDDENTGVVLESSSSISFINNDGFFDDIFDTLIWENRSIEFYSWSPLIEVSQAQRLFSGVIESKDFDEDKIKFVVKDFVFKLKNQLRLENFSESDGDIQEAILGTPKRRIYGQVQQAQTVGIDQILDGFPLTGTISVSLDGTALVGVGTQFLKELSPQDEIYIVVDGILGKLQLDTIDSDTTATLGQESDFNVVALTGVVRPKVPYRFKNRRWHIAGHKLREPTAEILSIQSNNRVTVDSVTDFFSLDSVKVNAEYGSIRRISGDRIVFNQALSPLPSIGDFIVKNPVQKVFFGSTELIIDRDWTLTNTTESIIELDTLAEFNIAPQRAVSVTLLFTNGSRSVTTASVIDLRTIVKSRDWIRKNSITETQWYEVLDVKEQTITLRTVCTGVTQTIAAQMKNVDLIGDDSLITVNCLGMEYEGAWVKTAADAVKHLVDFDGEFLLINDESFAQANSDCDYILSMVIPAGVGDNAPKIKDILTLINESVFGSLYSNGEMELSFSILNARKPESMQPIKDDDILSWEVGSTQAIVNEVKVNYRPFVDIFSGSSGFKTLSFTSQFVDELVGIKNTEERTIYLYEESKATIIAQRIALYKSLSNCKVTIKGKLNLAQVLVNDKVYLRLDRLYKRYGGQDREKIGIVTGVKKNGFDTDIDFIDLGNIFNRIPSIAPNTTPSYLLSERSDVVKYGYILDNDTLTPDDTSESELGNNLIG